MSGTRRPTKVKVGWANWTIQYLNEKQWLDHPETSDNGGETHAATQSIYIRLEHPSGTCNEVTLREVVLHEILHAIFHTANLGYGSSSSCDVASSRRPSSAEWLGR
jgi:hypothetical protein